MTTAIEYNKRKLQTRKSRTFWKVDNCIMKNLPRRNQHPFWHYPRIASLHTLFDSQFSQIMNLSMLVYCAITKHRKIDPQHTIKFHFFFGRHKANRNDHFNIIKMEWYRFHISIKIFSYSHMTHPIGFGNSLFWSIPYHWK